MQKAFYLILLLVFSYAPLHIMAQVAPATQWQTTIPGRTIPYNFLKALCETKEGGFIGASYSQEAEINIFRVDKNGKLLSQEKYAAQDRASNMIQEIAATRDGGFVYAGDERTSISNGIWGRLVKVDTAGKQLWSRYYKSGDVIHPDAGSMGPGTVLLTTVSTTSDGGYLLGATVSGTAGGDKKQNTLDSFISANISSTPGDFWVIKTDDKGEIQWEKTLGSKVSDVLKVATETKDGGYIVGGSAMYASYYGGTPVPGQVHIDYLSNGEGIAHQVYVNGSTPAAASGDRTSFLRDTTNDMGDMWLAKLDKSGNKLWDKTIGGKAADRLAFIIPTKDSGYFVGGTSTSPVSGDKTGSFRGGGGSYAEFDFGDMRSGDYWLLKLNKTGAIVWQKTIGGSAGELLVSGYEDKDGGFVIGGTSASGISGEKTVDTYAANPGEEDDFWILKLSSTGDILWQKALGGNTVDVMQSMIPTKNGAFIVGGYTYSPASGNKSAELSMPLYEGHDIWLTKFGANQIADTVCSGKTYQFDGKTISLPGIYTSTSYVHAFDGSDSLVELTLSHFESMTPVVNVQQDLISSTGSYNSYQWLLNGVAIPQANSSSFIPKEQGKYQLVVTNALGCSDTSAVYLPKFKPNLYVPNVFSPNGDGKNDVLKVYGNNITNVRLMVFNQWGEKVFESQDGLTIGWDGRVKGKIQPAGVYIYIMQAVESNGNVLKEKGTLSIIK